MRRSAAGLRPATHSQRGTNAKLSDCCAGARPQVRHAPSRARQGGLCGAAGCALLLSVGRSLLFGVTSLSLSWPSRPCYYLSPNDFAGRFDGAVLLGGRRCRLQGCATRPRPASLAARARTACMHANAHVVARSMCGHACVVLLSPVTRCCSARAFFFMPARRIEPTLCIATMPIRASHALVWRCL